MGASTAYHLAKRGCTNVVVLEAGEMFGLGSTGLNAGGIRYQFATAVNIELSKLSIEMMERFAERDGSGARHQALRLPVHARQRGRSRAVPAQRRAPESRTACRAASSSTEEIAALAPEVDLTGIIGGTWCPRDGLVDPHGLLQGYVSNARRLGATLVTQRARDGDRDRAAAACSASSRARERSTRRRSSSPPDRGRDRSARWRASICRFSRSVDRSPSRRRSRTASGFPVRHRLLARALLSPRGQRHSHRNVEPRRAAWVRHERRRSVAAAPSRERYGAPAAARRRGDRRRMGGAVRGDARRSADPRTHFLRSTACSRARDSAGTG